VRKERKIDMRDKILHVLAEICEDESVKDDLELELFESGLLDSLGFAEFLVELEEQFDIVISPSEVERDEIDTPEKILELVESRI
jgi:D-alanine--poly(phosphoribitol) ligase subunit 2